KWITSPRPASATPPATSSGSSSRWAPRHGVVEQQKRGCSQPETIFRWRARLVRFPHDPNREASMKRLRAPFVLFALLLCLGLLVRSTPTTGSPAHAGAPSAR